MSTRIHPQRKDRNDWSRCQQIEGFYKDASLLASYLSIDHLSNAIS